MRNPDHTMLARAKQRPMWVYPVNNPAWLKKVINEFNIHPVTAQILVSRNFNDFDAIHQFLYAKLPNLPSPDLFPDMKKAVHRIMQAVKNRERILIYGDNDVDGMTACALLTEFFQNINVEVFYYVPNRTTLDRSIISDALSFSLQNKCTLLITVDCGITAAKEIAELVKNNVDVIITDHHEPTSSIPHCAATLNPKLLGSTYPNRELTGVGVAFKLAHALTNALLDSGMQIAKSIDLKNYLDLVALGTISDMGALLGENRILVRYGLRQLEQTQRIGLIKLCNICELELKDLTPIDVASKLAPRLNSLGRIAEPRKGVELLLIKDEKGAEALAKELDLFNIERQKIEREASEEIEQYFLKNPSILKDKAIVLHSENWHPGIIAIITARIAKQYNRPTLIIAIEDGVGKGSIRTIPEFPLLPVLKENAELLVNFGGHNYAAGLTIKEQHIQQFKKVFIQYANKNLNDQDVISKIYLDAHADFDDLTFDFMESLKLLEPYGNENPPPLLYCDAEQTWPPKVVGKTHLKMFLAQEERMLEGIAFGMLERRTPLRKKNLFLRIAFTPHINVFLSKSSIQLQIREFQIL